MIQKKVCLLGASAVGKTSLVARFVRSIFSDRYLTTVGVVIDKKRVLLPQGEMELILWDLNGEDEFQKVRMSYLRGASAFLVVADGTRQATLDAALELKQSVEQEIGRVPFALALNKVDLADRWDIGASAIDGANQLGWKVIRTSAKTGEGVDEAFLILARAIASR